VKLCECYRKALVRGNKLDIGLKGIIRMIRDPVSAQHIPFVTTGDTSSLNLRGAIRCCGEAAIHIARKKHKDEAVTQLEACLRSGAEDKFAAGDAGKQPDPTISELSGGIEASEVDQSALYIAIRGGDLSSALLLLSQQPVIDKAKHDKAAFLEAAKRGWYVVVKCLLESGAVLEWKDDQKRTALSHVAETGDINTFDHLLRKGAFSGFWRPVFLHSSIICCAPWTYGNCREATG
jgi:hypothetical protein